MRERHIKGKELVLILAFFVGIFSGCAAIVLKFLIHFISTVLTGQINMESGNYLYILLPAAGVRSRRYMCASWCATISAMA